MSWTSTVPPAELSVKLPDVVVIVPPSIWTLSTRSSVTTAFVPIVTPSIDPPFMSAPDDWKASKYAVPSIYKSCHLSDEVPKSWVSSADGTNALSNLPVAVIVSLVALPRSVFPLTVKFPETVTLLGNPIWIWLFDTVVSISFVVPAKLSVSVPTVTLSFDPESAPTVSVVSILSMVALTAFADTRVSWLEDTDARSVSTLV